jgi:uncharacterized protein YecT (DUF1311 family)
MAKPKKTSRPAPKKKTAPPARRARNALEDKRPDAATEAVVTHARNLSKQVRADASELTRAKVTVADATQIDVYASALEGAQQAWITARDERGTGIVATSRAPLRAGRDQIFAALRTFVDEGHATHKTLDDIGDVTSDDDLVDDTTRLLALTKKHRRDLDGTDVTPARVDEVRAALDEFKATRGGHRDHAETGDATSAQAESEALRKARRARNVAFWTLAKLVRTVCKRGQYAFRDDREKRAKYTLYHAAASAPDEKAPPAPKPPTPPR